MSLLSIALDPVEATTAFYQDQPAAEPELFGLSSRALLLGNGWIFATLDDWPAIEESTSLTELTEVVGLSQALAIRGTEASRFNRIDYLAALFGAAADLACPHVQRDRVKLAVAVPSYAVAAAGGTLEIQVPRGLDEQLAARAGLRRIDLTNEEVFQDIRRAAHRSGFWSVTVEPAAMAVARLHLALNPAAAEALTGGAQNRACVVELGEDGLGFVPFHLQQGSPRAIGQALYCPFHWASAVRECVVAGTGSGWPQATEGQREAIWRRFRTATTAASPLAFETEAARVRITDPELGADWTAAVGGLKEDLQRRGLIPDDFVKLLTLADDAVVLPIVRYMMSGFGLSVPGLVTALRSCLEGKPGEAKQGDNGNSELLGVLDLTATSVKLSPALAGLPRRDAAVRGLALLDAAEGGERQPSRSLGAGIYHRIDVEPAGQKDNAQSIELEREPRPLLKRVVSMEPDGKQGARFRIALASEAGSREYHVTFSPQPWEANQRLEIELRVDEADRIELSTRIGGEVSQAQIQEDPPAPSDSCHQCLDLGRFELFLDPDHKRLTESMTTGAARPAANYQLYRPLKEA